MLTRKPSLVLSAWAIGLSLSACGRGLELQPADTARSPSGFENAAMSEENGVRVVAEAVDWPGDALIAREITALRITVDNVNGSPLEVRYSDFTIVSLDGTRYHAIPPFRVSGAVPEREPRVVDADPLDEVDFEYEGFAVAPSYRDIYTGIDAYGGPFAHDIDYYDTYYSYWEPQALPTSEMLMRALPEGVVYPGGRISGFVYFQEVDEDEDQVVLSVDLERAERGGRLATLQLPFDVD